MKQDEADKQPHPVVKNIYGATAYGWSSDTLAVWINSLLWMTFNT